MKIGLEEENMLLVLVKTFVDILLWDLVSIDTIIFLYIISKLSMMPLKRLQVTLKLRYVLSASSVISVSMMVICFKDAVMYLLRTFSLKYNIRKYNGELNKDRIAETWPTIEENVSEKDRLKHWNILVHWKITSTPLSNTAGLPVSAFEMVMATLNTSLWG